MKKLYFIAAVILLMLLGPVYASFCQTPEAFTYQAEARDSRGRLLANTTIDLKATILNESGTVTPTVTDMWHGDYNVKTDKFGLFTIVIGSDDDATNVVGDFPGIDWGNGKFFLKIEIKSGGNWNPVSTSQLLSVPYALYAKNAGNAGKETDPVFKTFPAFGISSDNITYWNTAYGWGDHSAAGYLKSITEIDPVFSVWDKSTGIGINALQVNDFQTSVTNNAAVMANTAKISYPSEDASKLSGIAAGAEVNVNADWNAGSGDAQIMNKPDLSVFATKDMAAGNITNLADPVNARDAVTKAYVDQLFKLLTIAGQGVRDADGNHYPAVLIGSQVWMAENLKTTKYNDGTDIPNVSDEGTWNSITTGAYCWYNNDQATYGNTYGALYNWFSVSTNKLCPAGWHVPSVTEWTTIASFLGGASVAGGKMKESGTTHWVSPNTGATNESGFLGLPGGHRISFHSFFFVGSYGEWWTSTEESSPNAFFKTLINTSTGINGSWNYKQSGFSVRCVRD